MALYNREQTKSFYSEIAHEQDICYYCEKAIQERRRSGQITLDEMHKELRLLRGKLTSKRVMKFRYVGHDFCACPECIAKIYEETCKVNTTKETIEEPTSETPKEESTTDAKDSKNKSKSKNKAKDNASK